MSRCFGEPPQKLLPTPTMYRNPKWSASAPGSAESSIGMSKRMVSGLMSTGGPNRLMVRASPALASARGAASSRRSRPKPQACAGSSEGAPAQ